MKIITIVDWIWKVTAVTTADIILTDAWPGSGKLIPRYNSK
jgi:hypothetical protein